MPMSSQTLSFRLRIARNRSDLRAACAVRAESYGHHLPHLRAAFELPDSLDLEPDTAVFVCVDKATGQPVGTARVQTNVHGPLLIETSIALPEAMHSDTRAEITRLAVAPGADPLIKLALVKASYLFCVANQVRWTIIGARSEALCRQYRRLGFRDLFEGGQPVPLKHAGQLPHHVLAFNVTTAERHWHSGQHPLYQFMADTMHRDIDLFTSEPALQAPAVQLASGRAETATV
jgi:hypothetical protein